MEIQELVDKANETGLTEAEQQELLSALNAEMVALKEQDPVKYLELLKQLNGIIEELNKDLRSI